MNAKNFHWCPLLSFCKWTVQLQLGPPAPSSWNCQWSSTRSSWSCWSFEQWGRGHGDLFTECWLFWNGLPDRLQKCSFILHVEPALLLPPDEWNLADFPFCKVFLFSSNDRYMISSPAFNLDHSPWSNWVFKGFSLHFLLLTSLCFNRCEPHPVGPFSPCSRSF